MSFSYHWGNRGAWGGLGLLIMLLAGCQVYDEDLLARLAFGDRDSGVAGRTPGWGEVDVDEVLAAPTDGRSAPDVANNVPAPVEDPVDAGPAPDASAGGARDAGQPDDVVQGPSQPPDAGPDTKPEPPDECPDDPDKRVPGACGCGVPDHDTSGAASCQGLVDALRHRYSFEGAHATLTDSAGGWNGSASMQLSGDGTLSFNGQDDRYGTLAAGLVSSSTTASIELWVRWQGGAADQALLSFGHARPALPATCAGPPSFAAGTWRAFCLDSAHLADWETARAACQSASGALLAVHDDGEQQLVAGAVGVNASETVWTGGNDLMNEGAFHWADASSRTGGGPFTYTNWRPSPAEPDNFGGVEHCVVFRPGDALWLDAQCGSKRRFACEWRGGHRGVALVRGLSLTPADGSGFPRVRVIAGPSTVEAVGSERFPRGAMAHVVLVLDPSSGVLNLYVDAALAASAGLDVPLAELRDLDNWLGRSHIATQPPFNGVLTELRVYDRALSALEVLASATAGPDPAFL